jgi:hypothetical protein
MKAEANEGYATVCQQRAAEANSDFQYEFHKRYVPVSQVNFLFYFACLLCIFLADGWYKTVFYISLLHISNHAYHFIVTNWLPPE